MCSSATCYLNLFKEQNSNATQQKRPGNKVEAIVKSHYVGFAANGIANGRDRLILCRSQIRSPTDKKLS